MLRIKNVSTKVEKEVSKEEWDAIQKNNLISKKWTVVESAKTPPEVAKLQDKTATAKDETPKNSSK